MAYNGRPNGRTGNLPYGIIVGRLLSYLGHPVMANARCADIPDPLGMKILDRYHLPSDPNCVGKGPDTETHSTATCHPPTSFSRDEDDLRMLPFSVKPVCQKCGDSGYAELLIYCHVCRISAEHRYCLNKIPKEGDYETTGLESQQGVQSTSPIEVNEEKSNRCKK
ncbi:hypothetical protein MKX01_005495, partial [Papaver californicum]